MTTGFSILHGHGDLFAWLARGFASSIGWMLARAIGWPVALLILLAGALFLWWRKRRVTRRRRNEDAQNGLGVYSSEYGTQRAHYGSRKGTGGQNGRR